MSLHVSEASTLGSASAGSDWAAQNSTQLLTVLSRAESSSVPIHSANAHRLERCNAISIWMDRSMFPHVWRCSGWSWATALPQALACCGSWWLLSQSSGLTTANGAGDPNDLAFQDYCTKSVSFDMRIMELSDVPASSRECQTAPSWLTAWGRGSSSHSCY